MDKEVLPMLPFTRKHTPYKKAYLIMGSIDINTDDIIGAPPLVIYVRVCYENLLGALDYASSLDGSDNLHYLVKALFGAIKALDNKTFEV